MRQETVEKSIQASPFKPVKGPRPTGDHLYTYRLNGLTLATFTRDERDRLTLATFTRDERDRLFTLREVVREAQKSSPGFFDESAKFVSTLNEINLIDQIVNRG